jgi:signal transduction histidine kinase
MTGLTIGLTGAGHRGTLAPALVIFAIAGIIAAGFTIIHQRCPSFFATHFGWLPVSVGTVTYPLWWWYSNEQNNRPALSFFEISAQVLPVLLLAAIIDVEWSRSRRAYRLILPIIAVFLGELVALNILAFGEDPEGHPQAEDFDSAIVAACLTSTIIALVMAVLGSWAENEEEKAESSGIRPNQHAETGDGTSNIVNHPPESESTEKLASEDR